MTDTLKNSSFKSEQSNALMVCIFLQCLCAILIFNLNCVIIPTILGPHGADPDVREFIYKAFKVADYAHWFQTICTLFSIIFFLRWLLVIIKNTRIIDAESKIKTLSAYAAVFIPLFNLVAIPVLVLKVWKCCTSGTKSPGWLVWSWWTLWLITCSLHSYWGLCVSYVESHSELALQQMVAPFAVDNLGQIMSLVPGFLFLVLLSKTNRMQTTILAARNADSPTPQNDLLIRSFLLIQKIGMISYYLLGLVAWIMSANFVCKTFAGFWWLVAVLSGPVAAFIIPWYAAFAKGDWSLVLICYGGGIAYATLSALSNLVLEWIYKD